MKLLLFKKQFEHMFRPGLFIDLYNDALTLLSLDLTQLD